MMTDASVKLRIIAAAAAVLITFTAFATQTSSPASSPGSTQWPATIPPASALFRHAYLAASLLEEGAASATRPKLARVVVTLGTFGTRADALGATVASLLAQTRPPARIYVALPASVHRLGGIQANGGAAAPLPPSLAALESELGRATLVILHPPDFGPSTKLLPTLLVERDPRTVIVVVDDDVVYDPRTIEALVEALETPVGAGPERGACFACEEPRARFHGLQRWLHTRATPGVCRGYASAYAGVAYRRGHFDDGVFNYSGAPAGCRLHDDVWIGGYLHQRGRQPVMLTPGFASVLAHRPWDAQSVHSVRDGSQTACMRHFGHFQGDD